MEKRQSLGSRALSVIMSIVMAVSLMPLPAYAETATGGASELTPATSVSLTTQEDEKSVTVYGPVYEFADNATYIFVGKSGDDYYAMGTGQPTGSNGKAVSGRLEGIAASLADGSLKTITFSSADEASKCKWLAASSTNGYALTNGDAKLNITVSDTTPTLTASTVTSAKATAMVYVAGKGFGGYSTTAAYQAFLDFQTSGNAGYINTFQAKINSTASDTVSAYMVANASDLPDAPNVPVLSSDVAASDGTVSVERGASVKLTASGVTASENASLSYVWYRNDEVFKETSDAEYSPLTTAGGVTAKYEVAAKNTAHGMSVVGEKSNAITITVGTTGTPTDTFSGHESDYLGTEKNPHIISTKNDLEKLRSNVNGTSKITYEGKHFIINENVSLSGASWGDKGIGYSTSYYFAGSIDGCGHTISGLSLSTSSSNSGLVGYLKSSSASSPAMTIENLKVEGSLTNTSTNASYGSGLLVGYIAGSSSNVTIQDCVAKIDSDNGLDGKVSIGGLVGYNSNPNTSIKNCLVIGSIKNVYLTSGGIIGNASSQASANGVLFAGQIVPDKDNFSKQTTNNQNTVNALIGRMNTSTTISKAFYYAQDEPIVKAYRPNNNTDDGYAATKPSKGMVVAPPTTEGEVAALAASLGWNGGDETSDLVYKELQALQAENANSLKPLTLNTNGGQWNKYTPPANIAVGKGYLLPTAEDISKDDAEFEGWYTEDNGGGTKVTQIKTTDAVEDIAGTYYAKWNGTEKTAQEITLTANTLSLITGGGADDSITASGAHTELSVTSSDTSIATASIDKDGKITVTPKNKVGEATITVSAPSNETYNAATATITVTVSAPPSSRLTVNVTDGANAIEGYTINISGATKVADTDNQFDLVRGKTYTVVVDANGYTSYNQSYSVAENADDALTLPVTLSEKTYTISYTHAENGAGGVTNANPTQYTISTDTITLVDPERAGYSFTGWTTQSLKPAVTTPTKGLQIAKGSYGNMTFAATWSEIPYTVSLDAAAGTISAEGWTASENPAGYYLKKYTVADEDFTLPTPTRDGYEFDGWTGEGIETAQKTVTIAQGSTGAKEYTANWTKLPEGVYTVTFTGNGGTPATQTLQTLDGALTTQPVNPTYADHAFEGWYTDAAEGTAVNPGTATFTANTQLFAHWADPCTVTITIRLASAMSGASLAAQDASSVDDLTTVTVKLTDTTTGASIEAVKDNADASKYTATVAQGHSYTVTVTATDNEGDEFVQAEEETIEVAAGATTAAATVTLQEVGDLEEGGFSIYGVEDALYTGEQILPKLYVSTAKKNGTELKYGEDYTYKIYSGSLADPANPGAATVAYDPADPNDSTPSATGDYTVVVTGIGSYSGTLSAGYSIGAYFTVFRQVGDSGERVAVKEYTADKFAALKSASTDPVSALYYGNEKWSVATAATYVTLDDLLKDASGSGFDLTGDWKAGSSMAYRGNGGPFDNKYSYETVQAMSKFYPNTGASTQDASGEVAAPFVFALTGYSASIGSTETAAVVQGANVTAADAKNAPRVIFGVAADDYASAKVATGAPTDRTLAGYRLWSNTRAITIIVPGDAKTDLAAAGYKVFYVDDKGETGDIIKFSEQVALKKNDKKALKLGEDYTYKIYSGTAVDDSKLVYDSTDAGSATGPKEKGDYLFVVTGTGAYEGTVSTEFSITDYFTVYRQVSTSNSEPVEIAKYTKGEFAALASNSADSVSGLYAKGGWSVATAATYVTLDDLLANATQKTTTGYNLTREWAADGTTLTYGTTSFTNTALSEMKYFYPNTAGTKTDTTGAVDYSQSIGTPFVFALTQASGTTASDKTAAQVETANKAAANDGKAPRTITGVAEADYLAGSASGGRSVAGARFWDNVSSITLTVDPVDISKYNDNIQAKYGFTGKALDIDYAVYPKGGNDLALDTDYTVTVTDADGNEYDSDAVVAQGTYTVTFKGIGDYTGTITETFQVVPYFTVYRQAGDNDPEVVAVYTESQFKALKSSSADPVSALYYKSGWSVSTAATYVTLDDLLADAGIDDQWAAGASIAYGEGSKASDYTYEEIAAANKFYPKAQQTTSSTDNPSDAPFVFSLTEFSSKTTGSKTAGDVANDNVSSANANNTPRVLFGISEDNYKDPENAPNSLAAGMRLWSGTTYITIKVTGTDISGATVKAADVTYDGTAQTPAATVTLNGKPLTEGTDYTLAYSANTNAGTATVTATGIGSYTGTATGSFKVNKAQIAQALLSPAVYDYDGAQKSPSVTVLDASGKVVAAGQYTVVTPGGRTEAGTYTYTVTATAAGNYSGTATATMAIQGQTPAPTPAPASERVPIYRVYNLSNGEHLYTTSYEEVSILVPQGWRFEGIAWYAPKTSSTPVYRVYDRNTGEHFYTSSAEERDIILSWGNWNYEDVAFYSDDAQGTPVYRLHNEAAAPFPHHFTTSMEECDICTSQWGWSWEDQRIAWYGLA